jgi:hypothetical protein
MALLAASDSLIEKCGFGCATDDAPFSLEDAAEDDPAETNLNTTGSLLASGWGGGASLPSIYLSCV